MNFGSRIYAAGAIALGLAGLVWGDFVPVWQPVPAGVPGRTALAYATAAALLLGGAALLYRRSGAAGAAVLTLIYLLGAALLHAPHLVAHPSHFGPWAGAAQQLALASGGLIAFAWAAKISTALKSRMNRIGALVFGICVFVFGVAHFVYPNETAALVPTGLAPGPLFWAHATGAADIAASLAIISGVQAKLAARLLSIMFVVFALLVHAPLLVADPTSHLHWVMNAVNLALLGAAWAVADSLAGQALRASYDAKAK
jgi:uncharacterized membrane protein YphA (DoxX/SURF4 family)